MKKPLHTFVTFIFVFVFSVFFSEKTQAQFSITIGTGATGNSYLYAPVYSFGTTAARYERIAYVYPASTLTGLNPGQVISSFEFNRQSATGSYTAGANWKIYVKNISATDWGAGTLDWATSIVGATKVFDGDPQAFVGTTAGWRNVTFTTPYAFNTAAGTSLAILCEYSQPAGSGSAATINFFYDGTTSVPAFVTNSTKYSTGTAALPTGMASSSVNHPHIKINFGAAAGVDAGLVGFPSLTGQISPGTVLVNTKAQNFGSNTLTAFGIDWTINGVAQPTVNFSGALLSTKDTVLTLGSPVLTSGTYTIKAWTKNPNGGADGSALNDTITKTITVCNPLGGTYTLNANQPASATNFTSFNAFITNLRDCGMSSAIVLNVDSNTYTGKVSFSNIPWMTSTNTLTINGNRSTITHLSDATDLTNYVVEINNANYITFRNFKLELQAASTKGSVLFMANANNCIIENNKLLGDLNNTASSYFGLNISGTSGVTSGSTNASRNIIRNNDISGGYFALYFYGSTVSRANSTGNLFENNVIHDAYLYGVYNGYGDSTTYLNNDIHRLNRATISTGYGIYFATGYGANKVIGNKIHDITAQAKTGTTAIYGIYTLNDGTVTRPNIIANNSLYNLETSGAQYCIYNGGGDYTKYYYNTVAVINPTATAGLVYGMYHPTAAIGLEYLNNNIYINKGGSAAKYGAYWSTITNPVVSNYNNIYVENIGTGLVKTGRWGTTDYALMVDWKTANANAFDQNSVSVDPVFSLLTSGSTKPNSPSLNDVATPVAGITTDITGLTRSITPDIGAYEFTPSNDDAGITSIISPVGICPGVTNVIVRVKNFGLSVMGVVNLNWSVNGVTQTPYSFSGAVASGSDTALTAGSYNFVANIPYTIKIWTSAPNNNPDANASNDTVYINNLRTGLLGTVTVGGAGANFATLGALAAELNANGICGPVVVNVNPTAGPYLEQIVINLIKGSSSTNTVTINGNGSTIRFTAPSSAQRSGIRLNGASYVTIDSFIIESMGRGATAYGAGVEIGTGSNYNTIKNCKIFLDDSTSSTNHIGIMICGSPGSYSTGGNYKYNKIINNQINGGYFGITIYGISATPTAAVGNEIVKNRVSNFYVYGIYSVYPDSTQIIGNDISRPVNKFASTFYGLYQSSVTRARIEGNKIHNAWGANPNTTNTAYCIYLTAASSLGNENVIVNNTIYDIRSGGSIYGIYGITSSNSRIYHNTISFDHTSATAGAAYGIYVGTSGVNIEVKNNAVSITRGGGGLKYGLYYAFTLTGATVVSNYNNIYVNSSGGNYGYINATAQATLANFRSATATFELNSISQDLNLNGTRNMVPQTGSPLISAGTPVTLVTKDLLGNLRSTSTPYIGAYEVAGDYIGPKNVFVPVLNTVSTSNMVLTNFATVTDISGVDTSLANRPRIYYKKTTDNNIYNGNTSADNGWKYTVATNNSSPFSFVIDYSKLVGGTASVGDRIEYFVVSKDLLGNIGIANASLQDDPTSLLLSNALFPVSGTNSYRIAVGKSGTILVGTNETYKTLTGTGGVFEDINNNILAGNIDIVVKSNLTETGINGLNAFSEVGGSGYKISIRPNADTLRTISGAYVGGLIRINGADRVTIDGRYNGTGSYFKLENTTATSGSATVQVISLGQSAGAENFTLRNCTVIAGTAGNAIPVHIGGSGIPYSSGSSNNKVSILNNIIYRGSVGIYSGSTEAFSSDSLLIENNIIGSDITAEQIRLYGMAIEVNQNAKINNNTIKNIINTSAQQAWGIAVYDGFKNGKITNNKIEKVSSGSGAFGGRGLEIISGKPNDNIYVANNFIGGITGPGSRFLNTSANVGIAIIATGGVSLYSNSINLAGNISATNSIPDTSAGIYIGAGSRLLTIKNNSVVNSLVNGSDTSYAYALYSNVGDTAFTDINYNNYYVGSNAQGKLARMNGFDLINLVQLQVATTKDLNSISGNPNYVSLVDLHAQGARLYQKGTPIVGITTDIDGDTRNALPCIGADEYTPPANDIEISSIIYPKALSCGKNTDSVGFVISNLGTASQTGFNIKVEITGVISSTINKAYNKVLAVNSRDTIYVGTFNSNIQGVANFRIYTELANDAIKNNDTILATREYSVTPAMPTANNVAICKDATATLVASNGALSYTWYDSAVGGAVVSNDDTLVTPVLTKNTKYWVETASGTSTGAIKISEIDIGGADMIEIQNLSQGTVNTTGWKVIVSDSYTLINSVNTIAWQLPTQMTAGQVLYKTDASADNYWGNNLFWNPGAFPSFTGWAMILDNNDAIVDAVFMNWPSANIAGAAIVYNAKAINITGEWAGNGINITTVAATNSVSRAGNKDNNNATDFQIVTTTKNATNSVLVLPYISNGCPSDRREVLVTINPKPLGSTVAQSTPFQGVFNAGTDVLPDAACLGDTLTYEMTAPTGFTSAGFGTTWAITNATVKTISGATPAGTITSNGPTLRYVAVAGDVDSTLKFTAQVASLLPGGCDSTITRYLKIYSAPVVTLGANQTVCAGTPVTLDAGNIGSTYLWSTGATTQTITVNSAGSYSVKVTNPSGCDSRDTMSLSVIPVPVATLGQNINVCVGTPVTLDAGNPGATYLWSTGATTQTISVSTSGNYYVIVTSGNCASSDTILVNFNALPILNLGSDLNICTSDTVTLDAGNAGSTYLWSTGATTRTIKVSLAGTYSVTVTNANGCISTDAVVVINKAAPNANYTYQGTNTLNIQFDATPQIGSTYSWNFNDPTSPANTSAIVNPIHQFTQAGTYYVSLTVTNVSTGCVSVNVDTVIVTFIGVNATARNTQNLKATPNPFVGKTAIEYTLAANANAVSIEVYDVVGRKVVTLLNNVSQQAGNHSLEYMNEDKLVGSGVYIVQLTVDGKTSIIRMVDIASK